MIANNFDGVDAATASRVRRGEYPIGRRLDLHGMTATEAHDAVDAALEEAHQRGVRCVLMIPGKGQVLRTELPRWLSFQRALVLGVAPAQPKHGGDGACYVLVKRKRDT